MNEYTKNNDETIAVKGLENNYKAPGESLRAARESMGLSVEDIASKLYISVSLVRDIENDEYKNAPAVTFVRGYLKAYAKLVEIDSDSIVSRFDHLGLIDKPAHMLTQDIYRKQSSAFEKSVPWMSLIFILVILGLIFLWWHSRSTDSVQVLSSNAQKQLALKKTASAGVTTHSPSVAVTTKLTNKQAIDPNFQSSENFIANYSNDNSKSSHLDRQDIKHKKLDKATHLGQHKKSNKLNKKLAKKKQTERISPPF